MEDGPNINRRKVLGNIAAAGSASLLGMTASVGATPEEASVDIDRLLESDRIQTLENEIPGLELRRDDARVVAGEQGVVIIPANYGTALTRPPGETDAVSFYFDEWVPGVDDDWVKGTEAQLRIADGETVLTRTATDTEAEAFLGSVGASEFDRADTTVAVQPESGKVTISHVDSDERRYDRIAAEPAQEPDGRGGRRRRRHGRGRAERASVQAATESDGLAAAKAGLEVTSRETEHFSESSQDISAQSSCDQDDVVFCIIELASCVPCGFASVTGPVFAACIMFVCLGYPAVPIATFLADIGCQSLISCGAEEAVDIAGDIIDEYGDEVPI